MWEIRKYGSVRGARGNPRSYRDFSSGARRVRTLTTKAADEGSGKPCPVALSHLCEAATLHHIRRAPLKDAALAALFEGRGHQSPPPSPALSLHLVLLENANS
jgi:hypothetical protein